MKFLTDLTLGKLTKWLRILGYDTFYHHHPLNDKCLRIAEKERRIVLTRKQKTGDLQYSGMLINLREDKVPRQLKVLIEKLSLPCTPEKFFSRCTKCNSELVNVLNVEEVAHSVPSHVLGNYKSFRKCINCNKIYWPGTHRENILKFIQIHTPFHSL